MKSACLVRCLGQLVLLTCLLNAALIVPSLRAAPPLEFHRFRFFLQPALAQDLSEAQLRERLALYVEDLNVVFSRQTIRRFTFDPTTDITLVDSAPHTGFLFGPPPTSGFEVWAYVQKSVPPNFGTYGGAMSYDVSGAGVADDLHWDAIHDRHALEESPASSAELGQYLRQLHNLVHEMEHIFGAGIGEYYSLRQMQDTTGVAPTTPISYLDNADTTDPYWARHADYWHDPLMTWLPLLSYADYLAQLRFANVTAAILNSPSRSYSSALFPASSRAAVLVRSLEDGSPLPHTRVRVWKCNSSAPYQSFLFADALTDSAGRMEFDWEPQANSTELALLLKAWPTDGRPPFGYWFSVFDAEEQKMVLGRTNVLIPLNLPPLDQSDKPPQLLAQPGKLTVVEGQDALLSLGLIGSQPLSFQWFLNGAELGVTTNAAFILPAVTLSQAGAWSARVSNPFGAVSTESGSLRVTPLSTVLSFQDVLKATGPGGADPGAVAVDSAGNLLWLCRFQGPGVMGSASVQGYPGGTSMALAKFDPAGRLVWLREAGAFGNALLPRHLAVDSWGNSVVLGTFNGVAEFSGVGLTNSGTGDLFLAKYSREGALLWARSFASTADDNAAGVAIDPLDRILFTGTMAASADLGEPLPPSPEIVGQFFLACLDPPGQIVWVARGRDAQYSNGMAVAADASGNIRVLGNYVQKIRLDGVSLGNGNGSGVFLADYTSEGRLVRAVEVPNRVRPSSLILSPDGGTYLSGSNPAGNLVLARFDSQGLPQWFAEGAGSSSQTGFALAVDSRGDILVAGEFFGTPMLLGEDTLINSSGTDMFLARFDATGRPISVLSAGGRGYDSGRGLAVGPGGRAYVLGGFEGAARFGPHQLTSDGGGAAYLAIVSTNPPPNPMLFTQTPTNQTAWIGQNVTLSASASGDLPLSYQWSHEGVSIPAATNMVLTLNKVQPPAAGRYDVTVRDAHDSTIRIAALVRVDPFQLSIAADPAALRLTITTPTHPHRTYILEVTASLSLPDWVELRRGTSGAVAEPLSWTAPMSAPGQQFYRVREQ